MCDSYLYGVAAQDFELVQISFSGRPKVCYVHRRHSRKISRPPCVVKTIEKATSRGSSTRELHCQSLLQVASRDSTLFHSQSSSLKPSELLYQPTDCKPSVSKLAVLSTLDTRARPSLPPHKPNSRLPQPDVAKVAIFLPLTDFN